MAEGLFAAPWRIFFVLAGVHAILAPPLSLWAGLEPSRHGTGMVLGLGLAAVAGYALTALPGWDG
ncbi:MAG TPA: NnrS family protein, partial [Paracoccus sp. (in: a-proteobacteria)]|nr:NnrS family protein [Paracoccus sp. (in: a-proteobacteria)]